jgi:hypothetical protein
VEKAVLDLLLLKGWQLEDVSKDKIGCDFRGRDPEGRDAFVEVKSLTYFGQAFTLTANEMEMAKEKRAAYRLALVRLIDKQLEIAIIPDPANSNQLDFVRQYRGWVFECGTYDLEAECYPLD